MKKKYCLIRYNALADLQDMRDYIAKGIAFSHKNDVVWGEVTRLIQQLSEQYPNTLIFETENKTFERNKYIQQLQQKDNKNLSFNCFRKDLLILFLLQ